MPASGRYGARRPSQFRNILPVVTIFCDDTATAVAYFDLLKKESQEKLTIHVVGAPFHGADANDMLDFVQQRRPSTTENGDQIWLLLDLDTTPDRASVKSKAGVNNVMVAFSQPCFEAWTLAHLEDTGELFANCGSVIARIRKRWKEEFGQEFQSKSQADYRKIMPFRESALARCRVRSEKNSQSWTEVWRVVERILADGNPH